MAVLHSISINVKIWPTPVEIPDPIPFPEDTVHASHDPDAVSRLRRILKQLWIDAPIGPRTFASSRGWLGYGANFLVPGRALLQDSFLEAV
jgi:hypothetical protein